MPVVGSVGLDHTWYWFVGNASKMFILQLYQKLSGLEYAYDSGAFGNLISYISKIACKLGITSIH